MGRWPLGCFALGLAAALALVAPGSAPGQAPPDDELATHLRNLQRKVDDPTLDEGLRERLALEMATTLDRAAQASPSAETRRARWTEAVQVLDRFQKAHPGHPLERPFEVQAAIYLWARGRSWADPDRVELANDLTRAHAAADLETAAGRLRDVVASYGGSDDVYAQNARFRLAQTLADLALVGPNDRATRQSRESEALLALERPPVEPSLRGYAYLLRANLLVRLTRYDEAAKDVDAAAAATPPPPEGDVLSVRLGVLMGQGKYDDARKAVDASRLDEVSKLVLRVRVDLADRAAEPDGPKRETAETTLFKDLVALRDRTKGGTAGRSELVAAASSVIRPGAGQPAEAWEVLADGALARGDAARAGSLLAEGARRADDAGRDRQAQELRLKGGAAYLQASKFSDAEPLFTRVTEDSKAGDLRPRAALLRAMTRGRALAAGAPGATTSSYAAALRYLTENFPEDAAATEARWLLGKLRVAEGDRAAATALWSKIPHSSPRWLDARVELAENRQQDLDTQRLNNDPAAVAKKLDEARAALGASLDEARGEVEVNALQLARARLELTPGVGRPESAAEAVAAVLRSAAPPQQRDAARRLQVLVLAQAGRFVEAEQAARAEVAESAADPSALLETVRRLDRLASEADSDLKTRRIGLLMGILLRPVAAKVDTLSPAQKVEAQLREVRARMFSGNDEGARVALRGWSVGALAKDPALLRDLAETYNRLEAYDLAIDVQKLRARLLPTGSLPWFDARYGQALAYYRAGKGKEALHLIDATSILHPELGGGDLKTRFIRLRQRIDPAG